MSSFQCDDLLIGACAAYSNLVGIPLAYLMAQKDGDHALEHHGSRVPHLVMP